MRRAAATTVLASWLLVAAGCKGRRAAALVDAGAPAPVATPVAATGATATAPREALSDAGASPRLMSNAGSSTMLAGDAGTGACKLLRPALMQPYAGAAAIRFVDVAGAQTAELVFNEAGHPRFSDAPLVGAAQVDVPMPAKTALPGCALAGDFVYCPDASGVVRRTRGHGDAEVVVARSRPGTRVAAASIGAEHAVLAFIEDADTTEGTVREARVALDVGPPLRLSEEGSGATSIDLATRGDEVLALIVDARVAMTPAHIRVVRMTGGALEVGRDAVVFVGGAGDRYTMGALALTKTGSPFALLPVPGPDDRFGLGVVRVSEPPVEDEPVVWSPYPNGLDPAPIAASTGVSPIRVARVRPSAASPDASRVLEIGELEPSGAFVARCAIADAAYIKDVDIEVDRQGATWIFWRDTHGSHLERRAAR